MEIRAGGPGQAPVSVAVTMRTPGNDFELAAGFLRTEGLIRDRGDVAAVNYYELPAEEQRYNVVTVRLSRPFDPGLLGRRNFYATSSCGVCGKASLDQVEVHCEPIPPGPVVGRATVLGLSATLRAASGYSNRPEDCTRPGCSIHEVTFSLCAKTLVVTTQWTSWWDARSWRTSFPCTIGWSWYPAGSGSRSSRSAPWPGSLSSARSPLRPAWRWTPPDGSA
jgi:hypothetical protein